MSDHHATTCTTRWTAAALLCLAPLTVFWAQPADAANSAQEAFFARLGELCGSTFVGETLFPADPGEDFRGKTLVAHIESCTENEIRVPFVVGENRSRTWIIRRVEGGLELKHDHRHEDGTPDEVTMYGGTTAAAGSALSQSFPADSWTAQLIPEAATNVWTLSFDESGQSLTYYLERHGAPRFKAQLDHQP